MIKPKEQTAETARIYDCIGIGFGPSNIALAISLQERGILKNTLFLERQEEVTWHPGMMIEGADIQHNPLRDFVTPRNPRSKYGFLSYLKANDRLFDYLNLAAPFPPRSDYASYVNWVARQFSQYVRLGSEVESIVPIDDERRGQLVEVREVSGKIFYAKTLVVGCGRSRYVPKEFEKLLSGNVVHSDDYLWAKSNLQQKVPRAKVAVVGGSQSAAEILLDLSSTCDVVGLTRGFGFKHKDLSPFTECIYYPEFVDYFHGAGVDGQNQIMQELWRSNYSAADPDVLKALNFKLYEEKITGRKSLELLQNSLIQAIRPTSDGDYYEIVTKDRFSMQRRSFNVSGIIFATGYRNFGSKENQEPFHPILNGLADKIVIRKDGGAGVARDYRLETKGSCPAVFLNGLCEASHGFGDAGSFSILSIRGETIANALEAYLSQELAMEVTKKRGKLTDV